MDHAAFLNQAQHLVCEMNPFEARNFKSLYLSQWPEWARRDVCLAYNSFLLVGHYPFPRLTTHNFY